ncbi:hypothetical protein [Bacillus altitudinis]|uniref:hypothetical protein n=1 Tax=Bacillus altitudinis TaxID=293387 RepID=UPI001F3463C7|nr:hypothetical protein [Bacillus altitudinis]
MKPSTINQTSIHESMDAILQDVKTTILQTNEIERFAVFHVKNHSTAAVSPLSFISRQAH